MTARRAACRRARERWSATCSSAARRSAPAACSSSCSSSSWPSGGLLADDHRSRPAPDRGHAPACPASTRPRRSFRDENGIAQIAARRRARPVHGPGLRPRSGAVLADGGLAAHRAPGRLSELFGAVDRRHRTRSSGRSAGARPASATSPRCRPRARRRSTPTPTGSTPGSTATAGSLGLPFVVIGLKAGLGGGSAATRRSRGRRLDSATWAKVQALVLGGNFDSEVFRIAADARLGDQAMTDQLFPAYPAGRADRGPDRARPVRAAPGRRDRHRSAATGRQPPASGVGAATAAPATAASVRQPAAAGSTSAASPTRSCPSTGLDKAAGSGATTASARTTGSSAPSKSATGHALLANDPHLGLDMPSVWIMNGLHCRSVEPGVPVRRRRRQLPGRARGHPRPQRADRVGRHERRARTSQDLFQRDSSTRRTRPTTCSRARRSRSRSAHEVIKVAGGRRRHVRRPLDRPRAGHQRRRATGSRRRSASTPCAGRRPTEPDRILDAFLGSTGRATGPTFRGALSRVRRRRRRTSSTPTSTATSGYQVPGRIPIRQDPKRPRRPARSRAETARTSGPATSPYDAPSPPVRPAGRDHRHGQHGRRRRALPGVHRPGVGPGLPGEPDHELLEQAATRRAA